jgi:hypothetical protein
LAEEAWPSCAAEERANLIALGYEMYGKHIVTDLQRAMLGLPYCEPEKPKPKPVGGQPVDPWEALAELLNSDTCWTILPAAEGTPPELGYLTAVLHSTRLEDGEKVESRTSFNTQRFDGDNAHLKVEAEKEAAAKALGIVLAACTETPEASAQSGLCPITIDFYVLGLSDGEVGVREAECLIAPVRSLAESVAIDRHLTSNHLEVGRKVQTRPLGILNVHLGQRVREVEVTFADGLWGGEGGGEEGV